MRLLVTLCLVILTVFTVEAQKKPKVSKAKTLWQNGEYAEAKEILDAAIEFEKIKDDGDTWYYRGLLYASIDTSSVAELNSLADNALDVSLESFNKAVELDDGKGYVLFSTTGVTTLDQQLGGYFNHYYSKAIKSYEVDDFEKASKHFETASFILPEDTNSVANAAYTAIAYEDDERGLKFFRQALERGALGKGMYANIINIHLRADNQEKALEVLGEGMEAFPYANDFKRQEITILINMGKAEEAKEELLVAIENEPEDASLRFALGLLYEELGDKEAALASYNASLEYDPTNYSSAFNRAVIIFNDANVLYKEKGALGISKADLAKAKSLEPKINEGFKTALPAWELVYSIQTPEGPTLETLLFLYAYLGEEKKADKIEEELDALEAAE